MRGRRWLLIGNLGLGSCLLAGCFRATLSPNVVDPPGVPSSRLSAPSGPAGMADRSPTIEESKRPVPSFDYLVSPPPPPPTPVQAASAENVVEKPAEKPIEPVEMRIQAEGPSPTPPADPSPPRMEVHPAPPPRPDSPPVQALRGLLERQPEEEIKEHLKGYDPATRQAILMLMTNIVQLEQCGGLARISPRDLAAWTGRLDNLTASLRDRSQLVLERMCFCSCIKNFGEYVTLPQEHTYFQPGESGHVYVEVRNLATRRQGDKYVTVLKARMEIYDENNRHNPPFTWTSQPKLDVSAAPRQDYFINFLFQIPFKWPAGMYTMRIFVEDWTNAPEAAKQVPESRIAQRTLDFRVGGPIAHPPRSRIAEAGPSP